MELVDENEGYGSEDGEENTNGLNGDKIVDFLGDDDFQPLTFGSLSGPSKGSKPTTSFTKPQQNFSTKPQNDAGT